MKKAQVKARTGRPVPVQRYKGHNSKKPVSMVETAIRKKITSSPQSIELDPCYTEQHMRSRIARLDFAKARGWLKVNEAADFLGLSPKTIYNLKLKGKLKPMNATNRRKLIFDLHELNKFLRGTK